MIPCIRKLSLSVETRQSYDTLHITEPTEYPAFWNEEWLRRAIDELDTRKMIPEERAYFA